MLRHASLILLGLCIMTGCGKTMESASSKASGTITLDGQPLTVGSLEFYPQQKGSSAFAIIQSDGTFSVDTSAGKTGLEPGDYNVLVRYEAPTTYDDDGNAIETETENPIPAKYRDDANPAITVTVPADGVENMVIELTSE